MEHSKIHLPEDALPHDKVIEWWYFNGNLKDDKGNRYAFMDCLFRVDVRRANVPFPMQPLRNLKKISYIYSGHSIVSDIDGQKSHKDLHTISLMSRDSFTRPLLYANYLDQLDVDGFSTSEMAETEEGTFHVKTERIDLYLKSKSDPVLHGKDGSVSFWGMESCYYSITDLYADGVINVEGEWIRVKGRAWMDHQWTDASYRKDKWTWFSIQLNNGTDIVCAEYKVDKTKNYFMTVVDQKRRVRRYDHFLLMSGKDVWESKDTKAKYPTSWTIEIPEEDIRLEVSSAMSDQEMIFGDINYWEGPTTVNATMGGKKIKGTGFMELVGYPSDYNALILAGKDLNARIQEQAVALFKKIF
jgi:predicted secreted hydrolase